MSDFWSGVMVLMKSGAGGTKRHRKYFIGHNHAH